MRCIFCKQDSSLSKAREHIIPESLGNIEHILPRGVVCDQCNNYFSREVEKPLLELDYFVYARFRNLVPNKGGRIPPVKALHPLSRSLVELVHDGESISIYPVSESDNDKFVQSVLKNETGRIYVPIPAKPRDSDKYIVSRFLGKVAVEVLAQRLISLEGGQDEVVDKSELEPLRKYVRYGARNLIWPYHERVIYHEGAAPADEDEDFEVLHEYNLLYTEEKELYLVLAIFGVEYVIDMGGPEIDGYIKWLEQNSNKSPLYP